MIRSSNNNNTMEEEEEQKKQQQKSEEKKNHIYLNTLYWGWGEKPMSKPKRSAGCAECPEQRAAPIFPPLSHPAPVLVASGARAGLAPYKPWRPAQEKPRYLRKARQPPHSGSQKKGPLCGHHTTSPVAYLCNPN